MKGSFLDFPLARFIYIGASIKDLGKKWFGFSKMEFLSPDELVERINGS